MEMPHGGQQPDEDNRARRRAAATSPPSGKTEASYRNASGRLAALSRAIGEIAALIEQMVVAPAPDVSSLAAKFNAILWQIEINESLLDQGDLRRLKRFGRDLRLVAGRN